MRSAPFDVAIVALVLQSACMYAMWSENYGNEGSELVGSIITSVNAIMKGALHFRAVALAFAIASTTVLLLVYTRSVFLSIRDSALVYSYFTYFSYSSA